MYDGNGKLSPSAFIPFCEFGKSTRGTEMGLKIEPYELPVCNSFKATILNDQLCYEVDLDKFKSTDNIENDLKSGLVLFLDYNEDRQVELREKVEIVELTYFVDMVDGSKDHEKAFVYLNTIGKHMQ